MYIYIHIHIYIYIYMCKFGEFDTGFGVIEGRQQSLTFRHNLIILKMYIHNFVCLICMYIYIYIHTKYVLIWIYIALRMVDVPT